MDSAEIRDYWDAEAGTFDEEPDHGLRDLSVRTAWWQLLRSVLPAAPAPVADLGCGTGSLSVLLAEHGYDVTGLDLSPAMVGRARAKAGGMHTTFLTGDAADPPLPAGAFAVVLARHVVWALPDPAATLGRWVQLLRPGGQLVLVEGRWSTGGGIPAAELRALVEPVVASTAVRPLTDDALWGRAIADERYLLSARRRDAAPFPHIA